MNTISVTIPTTPASDLRPNRLRNVSGWRRQEVVGELRGQTARFARADAPDVPLAGDVLVEVVVWWEKRRGRQDFDGVVGSLKPMLDGLADAGIYRDDKQVIGMTVVQRKDPDGVGYMTVVVRSAE